MSRYLFRFRVSAFGDFDSADDGRRTPCRGGGESIIATGFCAGNEDCLILNNETNDTDCDKTAGGHCASPRNVRACANQAFLLAGKTAENRKQKIQKIGRKTEKAHPRGPRGVRRRSQSCNPADRRWSPSLKLKYRLESLRNEAPGSVQDSI